MNSHKKNKIRSQFEPVTADDVMEVLSADELSTEDLYAVGVDMARRDYVEGWVMGRILVEFTRRLEILEARVRDTQDNLDRVTRRVFQPLSKPPTGPSGETPAPSGPPCPVCNSPSVLRTAKATGNPFYGCSAFPKCRGTSPYNERKG